MDEKVFGEKLAKLVQQAKDNHNSIKEQAVRDFFRQEQLTEEQIHLVMDYLASQKVQVLGWIQEDQGQYQSLSLEEQTVLDEYIGQLSFQELPKEGELDAILKEAVEGSAMAKGVLLERYMPVVPFVVSRRFKNVQGVEDLIQEGNIGLMMALEELPAKGGHEYLCRAIENAVIAAQAEKEELDKIDRRMIEKVQMVDQGIRHLTEELGHKVTIEELGIYLDMDPKEIVDIVRLAGEEIEYEEPQAQEVFTVTDGVQMAKEEVDLFEGVKEMTYKKDK